MNNLVLKNVSEELLRRLEVAAERHNRSVELEIVARLEKSFDDHHDTDEEDDVQRILRRVEQIRNQFSSAATNGN